LQKNAKKQGDPIIFHSTVYIYTHNQKKTEILNLNIFFTLLLSIITIHYEVSSSFEEKKIVTFWIIYPYKIANKLIVLIAKKTVVYISSRIFPLIYLDDYRDLSASGMLDNHIYLFFFFEISGSNCLIMY